MALSHDRGIYAQDHEQSSLSSAWAIERHLAHLNAGYETAAPAAIAAVENEIASGGLAGVQTRMFYDHRQFSSQKKQTEPADADSWTTKKTSGLRRTQAFTVHKRA
jgi:hypothetical protein